MFLGILPLFLGKSSSFLGNAFLGEDNFKETQLNQFIPYSLLSSLYLEMVP